MTARYELRAQAADANSFAIHDTIDNLDIEVLPAAPALERLAELNKAARIEKMREKRWGKRDTPKVTVEQVVKWKEAGLTFQQIAALAGISTPLASVVYNKEMNLRALQAGLRKTPLTDKTLITSVQHLMPTRTFNALMHPIWGYGLQGVVGSIRSTPDRLLRSTPNIGLKGLALLRALFGYSTDYKDRDADPDARLVDYVTREKAA
jgi:hypothetical protein